MSRPPKQEIISCDERQVRGIQATLQRDLNLSTNGATVEVGIETVRRAIAALGAFRETLPKPDKAVSRPRKSGDVSDMVHRIKESNNDI